MDIESCKCGSDDLTLCYSETKKGHYIQCETCKTSGSVSPIKGVAKRLWNAEMTPSAQHHENGTSYRDRVHSASIAILPLLMERWNEPGYSDVAACYESVRLAIIQIDAIDKAIAERESKHED